VVGQCVLFDGSISSQESRASMFYLLDVYPLKKVKPWVSVGVPLPCEKHGRADVVTAGSERIIAQISYGLVGVEQTPLNTSLSVLEKLPTN